MKSRLKFKPSTYPTWKLFNTSNVCIHLITEIFNSFILVSVELSNFCFSDSTSTSAQLNLVHTNLKNVQTHRSESEYESEYESERRKSVIT